MGGAGNVNLNFKLRGLKCGKCDLQGRTKTWRLSCLKSGRRGQSWVMSGEEADYNRDIPTRWECVMMMKGGNVFPPNRNPSSI